MFLNRIIIKTHIEASELPMIQVTAHRERGIEEKTWRGVKPSQEVRHQLGQNDHVTGRSISWVVCLERGQRDGYRYTVKRQMTSRTLEIAQYELFQTVGR